VGFFLREPARFIQGQSADPGGFDR